MFAAAFVVALVMQAQPGVTELRPTFTNTLVSTYPDGRTARLWLAADGTFTGTGRGGRRYSGVWQVDDGKLCMSQRRPIPLPGRYCTPIVSGGVGARWAARAVTGERITIELVPGRS